MKKILMIMVGFFVLTGAAGFALASDPPEEANVEEEFAPVESMSDPLESFNRFWHGFNDHLYFKVLKPVSKGYGWVMPQKARESVQNFFSNVRSPLRAANCAFQCNYSGTGTELSRFGINTTVGVVGLFDPADAWFDLKIQEEDFGQTLGCRWGPGAYLNFPFTGPTSVRDTIGGIVDLVWYPSIYVMANYSYIYTGTLVLEAINNTSLKPSEYEEIKRTAVDPYISLRDAYHEHREDLILR